MKKLILTSALLILCKFSYGQFRVDSLGHVGIGDFGNSSIVSLSNYNTFVSYIKPQNSENGLLMNNNSVGLRIHNNYMSGVYNYGIVIFPNNMSNRDSHGILAYTGVTSGKNLGVSAAIPPVPSGSYATAAVYGSSTSSTEMEYNGVYAGYFNGDVRVTGALTARLYSPVASPSNSSNVTRAPEDYLVTDQLINVDLLEINENRNVNKTKSNVSGDEQLEKTHKEFAEAYPDVKLLSLDEQEKLNNISKPSVRYGLDAEQLKEIYPELVCEDTDGNVNINYIEIVPLLVKSINELTAKIKKLECGDAAKEKEESFARSRATATSIDDELADVEVLSLDQNKPNPFTESTTIRMTIPNGVRSADLFVYDMSGKQVAKKEISDRGETSVTISSEGLHAGMFLYTLVADNKVVGTKRMILK